MSVAPEMWQVNIDGVVQEVELERLKQWIKEGQILPTDKVRKGNLSWIDARLAPALRGVFSGNGEVSPAFTSVRLEEQVQPNHSATPGLDRPFIASGSMANLAGSISAKSNACHNHPETFPKYICRVCGAAFCEQCPQYVSSSKIPVCPLCGDLCTPYEQVQERVLRDSQQTSGFGMQEFGLALRYPLKSPLALIGIASFYGLLLLGGLRTQLMAIALLFACLSQVIKQVAWGRLNRSFVPDFSDFSWGKDIFGPVLLSLGISLVTFGPLLLLLVAMWTGWLGESRSDPVSSQAQMEADKTQFTAEDLNALVNSDDSKKDEEAMGKLKQFRPANQAKALIDEHEPQSEHSSLAQVASELLSSSGMILGFGLLSLGWAIFYYPMALAVAGYSEDFWSVLNPMVGLDTIRRMRMVYLKAFFMYLGVQLTGFLLNRIVSVMTAPLALPLMGNLPGRVIQGFVTFYTSLVVACILGLSLYKCADQLYIPTD